MTTTVAVIGQLVGAGVFPSLADKYGRLVVSYTNAIALVICYILAAVVPWFSAFVILRFLLGAFGQVTTLNDLAGNFFACGWGGGAGCFGEGGGILNDELHVIMYTY